MNIAIVGGRDFSDYTLLKESLSAYISIYSGIPDNIVRNTQIIENADVVFAFWDGQSKGTKDSITKAKKLQKELHIISYGEKTEEN